MKKMIFSSMLAIGMIATALLMNGCSKDSSNDESPTPIDLGAKINQDAAKHGYINLVCEKKDIKFYLYVNAEKAHQKNVWVDLNNDGERQESEKITRFDEDNMYEDIESNIITIYGEITDVNCGGDLLTDIDISQNSYLQSVAVSGNSLKTLNVAKNTQLKELYCEDNQLTVLELGNNPLLEELYCNKNTLEALDVTKKYPIKKIRM